MCIRDRLLKGRLRPLHLLLPPAVYLLGILPAALMGRDFGELLTIYLSQAGKMCIRDSARAALEKLQRALPPLTKRRRALGV